jgi:hypothetical protein
VIALVTVVVGVSILEAGFGRDTAGSHWSVAAAIVFTFVVALVAGSGRQPTTSRRWLATNLSALLGWRGRPPVQVIGVLGWVLLGSAVIGWDLYSFVQQAHAWPTLSSLFGRITLHHLGRAVVFALWLATGLALALGHRRARSGNH